MHMLSQPIALSQPSQTWTQLLTETQLAEMHTQQLTPESEGGRKDVIELACSCGTLEFAAAKGNPYQNKQFYCQAKYAVYF